MVDGPRFVREEEFPAMLELVDRCFHHDPGGMRAAYPHGYDPGRPDRHAVVTDGDAVIAHVACIPDTLVLGDAEVDCWGISGVATDPAHRGEGLMSDLLDFWLDRMGKAGVPLAKLWGNRQRYGHFGWETAGRHLQFRLTPRSFSERDDTANGREHVERFDPEVHLPLVRGAHREAGLRVARADDEYAPLLTQRGVETRVWTESGAEAYAAVTHDGRSRTVTEFGGTPAGIEGLLNHYLRAFDTDELTVYCHPLDPHQQLVAAGSADWTLHTHRKLRLNDLMTTLAGFENQLSKRWDSASRRATVHRTGDGARGSAVLKVTGDDEAARLSWGGPVRRGALPSSERTRCPTWSLGVAK